MPGEFAAALAIFALVLGMGISWWCFGDDLRRLEAELEEAESDLFEVTEDRDAWKAQALADQASLELVLAEGEQSPLTAPLQVVRGGAL